MHLLISCIVAHCTMRSSVQWKSKNYIFVNLLEVSTKFCTISLLLFHCTNVEVSFTAIHKLACLPISQQWALELPMIRFYFMPTNQPIAPLQNYSQYHIHISLVLALSFFFLPFAPPPPPPPCVSYCSGLFEVWRQPSWR